jgi:hypothetical protein
MKFISWNLKVFCVDVFQSGFPFLSLVNLYFLLLYIFCVLSIAEWKVSDERCIIHFLMIICDLELNAKL